MCIRDRFKFGGFLDEGEYAAVEGLFGSDKVLEITGEKETAAEPKAEAKPKAAAKPAAVAAKPKPAPVEEEEAPAPKPKPAAKAAAPKPAAPKVEKAGASSLADEIADLMSDMDDDD